MQLARRVTKARESLGLSKAQFANKVGVTASAVSQWESGGPGPKLKHLRKIARVTKTPLAELVGG
jgi:transcriptional regulator with XRE-family HTH domain